MDEVIGARLLRVVRLSWVESRGSTARASGPTYLAFDGDRAGLITCRSDWALEWVAVPPGDEWRKPFDYEDDGGSWVGRDASTENPFDRAMGRVLTGWVSEANDVGDPVAVELFFEGVVVKLRSWEGEVQVLART